MLTEFEKKQLTLLEEQNRLLQSQISLQEQGNEIAAEASRSIWQRIADDYKKTCNRRCY